MQTCYNCGEQVDDNVLICPTCGALVKRYGPPIREQEAETASEAQSADGSAAVFRDARGRLRLRTGIKILLILGVIVSLYTALTFACVLLVFNDQEFYLSVWEQMPQFAALGDGLSLLMESVGAHYLFYQLYPLLLTVQAASVIWFLCSKRRLAFTVSAAATALVFLVTLLFVGFWSAVFYSLALLLSWLLLKKDWERLPN